MPLSVGARLGVFEILGPLGTGGMGIVYRAWDTQLRREVALKLLQPAPGVSGHDPFTSEQLLHEARAAVPLNHPHICTIYEVGEVDGVAYIAMEMVAGEPLRAMIARAPLAVERACRLGRQLADALEHAHTRGVIHGDFKSANVIVTPEGRAKVLDFGIARRTQSSAEGVTHTHAVAESPGTVSGTLAYMAPELLRGESAEVRTEIWALGAVLYEMVSGQTPFQARTASELSAAILRDRPKPLPSHLPLGLVRIIERCLAKEPAERFARAGEVAAALEIVEATTSGDVQRHPAREMIDTPTATAIRSPRVAIVILALIAAAGVLAWVLRDPGRGVEVGHVGGERHGWPAATDVGERQLAALVDRWPNPVFGIQDGRTVGNCCRRRGPRESARCLCAGRARHGALFRSFPGAYHATAPLQSWRFEWAPGSRAFLISNSGMISTAWSIPNPGGALFPPAFDGDPAPEKLQRVGARQGSRGGFLRRSGPAR